MRRLAPGKREEVLRLLAAGVSQCQTARTSGVARNTVRAIARQTAAGASAPRPQRCECGWLLTSLPCVGCRLRRLAAAGKLPAPAPSGAGPRGRDPSPAQLAAFYDRQAANRGWPDRRQSADPFGEVDEEEVALERRARIRFRQKRRAT